jgi:hypothetical protein
MQRYCMACQDVFTADTCPRAGRWSCGRAPGRRALGYRSMSRGNLQSSLGAIFSHHSVAAGENSATEQE